MSWKSAESSLLKGPFVAILFLFLVASFIGVLGRGCAWFGEGAQVAQEQFGPRALLKKYEWFKDAAASLDAKRADIEVYEGVAQVDPKDAISRMELAGMKASYNALAAEYNAAMAKFNYRFTNMGDLPPGADQPLPREFRVYVSK